LVIFEKRVPGLREKALQGFVARARRLAGVNGTVNVLLASSAKLRSLNRQFLGKNKPTDVLSFPAALAGAQSSSRLAGEIAIAADIAIQNARRLQHSPIDEVKILTLHGILHLAGFDHERDRGQMARMEAQLRQKLKLPVGVIERANPTRGHNPARMQRPSHRARSRP
jgi:probable rRNA maturation factor